jgi:pseudouridine kinase
MPDFETYHESPAPEAPVLVIGAAGIDLVGRLGGELKAGTSNPAEIRASFGGVARNVAENLSRLGHPVNLVTVVGNDPDGEKLLAHTAGAGVDTSHVLVTADHRTGSYLAVLNHEGEMQFALDDMGAIELLRPDYLREHRHLFKEASALFMDANVPAETMRTSFHLARLARLPIYADPASTSLAARLVPFLSRLQIITPNSREAAVYCGQAFDNDDQQAALQAAKHLVGQGVALPIITMAEFGVCYATSKTSGFIPAIRTETIDPTGAGDALTATVIFALLNDIPADEAVRLGTSAASLTLRYPGTVVPDLSLEKLYDQLII